MNLTISNKRNIPRISIKKRVVTNPQQHREPLHGYFNKVRRNNSLLNADQPTNSQSALLEHRSQNNTKKDNDSGYHNKLNSTAHSFKVQTNFEPKAPKSRFDNSNQLKLERDIKSNLSNLNPFQIKEQAKQENRREYMTYFQYQNLVHQGTILPNYFQLAAFKNDGKVQIQLSKSTQSKYPKTNRQPAEKNQSIRKLKSEFIEGIESLIQKHKSKNIRLEAVHGKNPIKTIISSKLGILSNQTIKEKLQEKWQKQCKFHTINKFLMTEESELASEKDTRQISVREDLFSASLKKNGVKESQNEGSIVSEIESLPNQQQKTRLKRIFTKKERPMLTDENMSRGEEYEFLEQNMVKINSFYKPKKLLLKHKIEWKV